MKKTLLIMDNDPNWGETLKDCVNSDTKGEWRSILCQNEGEVNQVLNANRQIDAAIIDYQKDFYGIGVYTAQKLRSMGIPTAIMTGNPGDYIYKEVREKGIRHIYDTGELAEKNLRDVLKEITLADQQVVNHERSN